MGQVFVRIDDRLIHGQIVTAWCNTLNVGEIIAIDDNLAQNPMLQSIVIMGVPKQYHPSIVTTEKAKELLQTETQKNRLVITRFAKNIAELKEFYLQIAITSWTPRGKNLGHGWSRRIYP